MSTVNSAQMCLSIYLHRLHFEFVTPGVSYLGHVRSHRQFSNVSHEMLIHSVECKINFGGVDMKFIWEVGVYVTCSILASFKQHCVKCFIIIMHVALMTSYKLSSKLIVLKVNSSKKGIRHPGWTI